MGRRYRVVLVAAALVVAGSVAAGIVLAFGGSRDRGLERAAYLRRVQAICQRYGRLLDRIPPPADIATPGEVIAPVSFALPVLRAQERAILRLEPPRELEARLARFFALIDRSLAGLELALRGARALDVGAMGRGELQFARARDEARTIAREIGFRC